MFGIGLSEMLIIMAVALLVFGPNKLPEVAKSIARGLRELRRAGDDLRSSMDLDLDDDLRTRSRSPRRASGELAHSAGEPAHIPGSELAPPPRAAAEEPWPRAAVGTLAQGALDEPSATETSPPGPAQTPAAGPGEHSEEARGEARADARAEARPEPDRHNSAKVS